MVTGGVAFATAAATSALASDMPPPHYLPPPRAPAYVFFSWNGAYVGINAGDGFGKSEWTDPLAGISSGRFTVSGGQIGATLGYNMQWGGMVFGFETDLDWSSTRGTTVMCFGTCKTSNDYLGTVRGRIGYAFGDRFLPYFTGGLAYGGRKVTGGLAGFSTTDTSLGWAAGIGLECAYDRWWSARIEYLHISLDGFTATTALAGPVRVGRLDNDLVRAAFNYRLMP